MEFAVKQKSRKIRLIIVDTSSQDSSISLYESDCVEKILFAVNLNGKNVHLYYRGKRLLKGREQAAMPKKADVQSEK
jgi:hypothetical protein